ncbi:M56 family metallopeptidase [Singulisphaera sp. Ch08]|uniref:M56 family metallopeptidase n=1 Tax=Singulisphaera sp. Ch08 TaxID=3120278 RepID=A0AAU7CJK6_9BACT
MPDLLNGLPAAFVVSGTVWLTLGLATARLLRRRPARAHSLLTLATMGALTTPLLVILVQQANWGVLPAVPAPLLAAADTPAEPEATNSPRERHAQPARPAIIHPVTISSSPRPTIAPSTAPERPWRTIGLVLWFTVSAALVLRLLADIIAGWRTVQRSRATADAAWVHALCGASKRIGGSRQLQPRLQMSTAVTSPALWGWSRPATILIPESATLPGNCEAVFCHELAHLRRRDHWTALLAELLVCILPWHPLAWATRLGMGECAEEACDDWAVACGCPPIEYAETLVGLTPTATPALMVAAVSRHSPLAIRVRRLLAGRFHSPRLGRGWIAGATLGTVALATTWALWQPRNAVAKTDHFTDDAPTQAIAQEEPTPTAEVRRLRVMVLDPEDKPIPDVKIHALTLTEDKGVVKVNRDSVTNAAGVTEVELPKTALRLELRASKPPSGSRFAGWEIPERMSGEEIPAEFTFRLESAVSAGCRILDEQGKPIPSAKVRVWLSHARQPASNRGQWSDLIELTERDNPVLTDAEGRWHIDNVPDRAHLSLTLFVSHDDYVTDDFSGDAQRAAGITGATLRQGTATLTLKRGVIVSGRVTAPNGKPIQNAIIVQGDVPNIAGKPTEFLTDAAGRYRLPAVAPREAILTVVAPGWAPQMRRVNLQHEPPQQDFRMEPGKAIRLRIIDSAGESIPKANVRLIGWQGTDSLRNTAHPDMHDTKISRQTDRDGLWKWTWAPDEPVKLRVDLKGYARSEFDISGGEPTRTIVLKREHRITGRVTDAVTGAPIPAFHVIPINVSRKEFRIAERNQLESGREGRLNYLATHTDQSVQLRVEAKGYTTQDGPKFRVGDDGPLTQDFRLRPSPPITGSILDASGQPVAKVEVILATPTQYAKLTMPNNNHKIITDASGTFTFPDPAEPWAVLAQTDSGYAIAEFPAGHHDAGSLRLQPWASVRGRFRELGRPVPGVQIILEPDRLNGPSRPRIEGKLGTVTDADGRFEFPRVLPGLVTVQSYLKAESGTTFHPGAIKPLDLQPGQRAEVWTSEGPGRP